MRQVEKQLQILLAHVLVHELAERFGGAVECLLGLDFAGDQRPNALIIGALEHRAHHEGGEEQRERDDH